MTNLEEAEKKIKEVKERKSSILNLDSLGLTSQDLDQLIPIIKKELPHLSVMNLTGNNIKSLPDSLASFNKLKRLYLDKNNFEILPHSLAKPSLETSLLDETKIVFDIILEKHPIKEIMEPAPTVKSMVEQESNEDSTAVKSVSYKNLDLFKETSNPLKRMPSARSSGQIDLGEKPARDSKKIRYRSI